LYHYNTLRDTARLVGKQVSECKLTIDVNEYVDSFRPDLMDMVGLCTLESQVDP
jgi:ATP-dependent RNA helicase DOB1